MQSRTWSAIAIGALFGAVIGVAIVALAAGRVLGSGIDAIVFDSTTGQARPTFLVNQASLYTLVVVASGLAGAVIAMVGYGVGKLAGPRSERFAMGPLALVGLLGAVVFGFATARTAVAVGGTISEGVVSLSVFRAVIVAIITGATTGAIIAGTVERISRVEALGLSGAAWPTNPLAFVRDAMAAMGLPALALLLGLGIVFGFSRVLLDTEGTGALILFGGAAAIVLFGAAAIAALPPRRDGE